MPVPACNHMRTFRLDTQTMKSGVKEHENCTKQRRVHGSLKCEPGTVPLRMWQALHWWQALHIWQVLSKWQGPRMWRALRAAYVEDLRYILNGSLLDVLGCCGAAYVWCCKSHWRRVGEQDKKGCTAQWRKCAKRAFETHKFLKFYVIPAWVFCTWVPEEFPVGHGSCLVSHVAGGRAGASFSAC